jgi:aminoglycoside phosphotransferase (APT) family kinase protein
LITGEEAVVPIPVTFQIGAAIALLSIPPMLRVKETLQKRKTYRDGTFADGLTPPIVSQGFYLATIFIKVVNFDAIAGALGGRLVRLSKLDGLVNECYKVEVDVAGRLEKFAVKLYRGSDSKLKAERELTLFKLMPEYGLRAPSIVLADLEGRLAGKPILAWRWVEGIAVEKVLENARTRYTAARAMGAALFRLHSIHSSNLEPRLFAGKAGFWEEEADSIRLLAKLYSPSAKSFSELAVKLDSLKTERVALIHGDYNPGNILVGKGGIYVIDLEGARLGDPMYDVAYACIFVAFKAGWKAAEAFALEYCKLARLDPHDIAQKLVAAAAKLYLLLSYRGMESFLRKKVGFLYPAAKILFLKPFKQHLRAIALEHSTGRQRERR